jgi:hypothetical protein
LAGINNNGYRGFISDHFLTFVVALNGVHELGDAEDGVVVGDDQPLPVVRARVLGKVLEDGLCLVAVTKNCVKVGLCKKSSYHYRRCYFLGWVTPD